MVAVSAFDHLDQRASFSNWGDKIDVAAPGGGDAAPWGGFDAPQKVLQHGGIFIAGQAQYADVNADGVPDLIFQGTDNAFWVSLGLPEDWGTDGGTWYGLSSPQKVLQHGGSFIAGQAQYARVNLDGTLDLIFQGLDNAFWVSLSTDAWWWWQGWGGFGSPQKVAQHGGIFIAGQAQYADVNGNGAADLIFQGLDNAFWVSLGLPGDWGAWYGFRSPRKVLQHGGSFIAGQAQYADVNGDFRSDVIFQGTDNAFWLSLGLFTSWGAWYGFSSPRKVLQHGGSFIAGQAQYADVNIDGKADLIFQGTDNAFWVSLSTGSGFDAPKKVLQHGGSFIAGQAQYVAFSGDDVAADLIFQGTDNAFWLSLNRHRRGANKRFIPSILSLKSSPAVVDDWLVIGGEYVRSAGTSMAAPHVSGVAALVRALHPEFSAEQVRKAIRSGSDDVGLPGIDLESGYGRLNAKGALAVDAPQQ